MQHSVCSLKATSQVFPPHVNATALHSDSRVFPRYPQISNAEASDTSLPGGKKRASFASAAVKGDCGWLGWGGGWVGAVVGALQKAVHEKTFMCLAEETLQPCVVEI